MNFAKKTFANSWPFLLGLFLGMWMVIFSIMGWDLSYFPGDLGDARFNTYILEHGHQYFFGNVEEFWNAPFMYPEYYAITYSDNLLGTLPLYSFFRFFGLSTLSAFQGWVIVLFLLNYTSCYHFLKWLLKNRYVAVLGAFVFTFSIALQSQMAHAQMFPRFWIPLALWMILLFNQHFKARYFFLAIFCLVMEFYSAIYLGFMLTVPVVVMLLHTFIRNWARILPHLKQWKWTSLMVLSVVINMYLLYGLMLPYYNRSLTVEGHTYAQIIESIPTMRSYLFSMKGSLLWDGLSNTASSYQAPWDHQIFPGCVALLSLFVFFILFLVRKSATEVRTVLGSNYWLLFTGGLFTFAAFFRIQGFSMYEYLFEVPGFSAMRSLTRIINVEMIFFAVAVGILFKMISTRQKSVYFSFFVGLALLTLDNYFYQDGMYRSNKHEAMNRVDELAQKMKHVPKGGLISYEPDSMYYPDYVYQLDAMLASQRLGLKCVNGYSATAPWCFDKYWLAPNEETRSIWFSVKGFTPDTVYVIK